MVAQWCRYQDTLRAKKIDFKKKLQSMGKGVWALEVQQLICEREKQLQLQLEIEAGLRKPETI